MGNLPEERIAVGTILVRSMVNKRAHMKVWPILFVCQSTGALHIQVAHDYGKAAFLLQYDHFVALRDAPQKVVSDQGSQLTAASSFITWSERGSPSKWEGMK